MPKIERAASLTSTPRIQSVTRPSTPELAPVVGPVASKKDPDTQYAGQAASPKDLVPRQANVSKSASPSALWGDAPKQVELDTAAFTKLSGADQQKVVEAAKAEHAQLGTEIVERVDVLDKRWNNSRLSTRTEALREYHDGPGRLGRRERQKLDGLVDRSEESQRKINAIRVRIDALPKTPEAKKAQVELRNELARELRRARAEQSKVVKEATEVIDTVGLKTDRLAVTEQIIEPSAPAQGSGDSLLDKIGRFFKLDSFFTFLRSWVEQTQKEFEQRSTQHREEMKVKDQEREQRVFLELIRQNVKLEAEQVSRARQSLATSLQTPAAPPA